VIPGRAVLTFKEPDDRFTTDAAGNVAAMLLDDVTVFRR
jgi:hypothetical protein